MNGVRRSQTVFRAEPSRDVGNVKAGGDPVQMRKRGQQSEIGFDTAEILAAIRLHEQFRHRDGRRHGSVPGKLEPIEDRPSESDVLRIRFKLIDERTGVQTDFAVTLEKGR